MNDLELDEMKPEWVKKVTSKISRGMAKGFGCFEFGTTLQKYEKGWKKVKIEDIESGDQILTVDESGRASKETVVYIDKF